MHYLIPILPLRLRPHHLLTYRHLNQIQALLIKLSNRFFPLIRSIHSSCDSRNLNLSPFCNLSLTSLAMWQPSVLETYGDQTTSYVDRISGPMRMNFPNWMEQRELITSLTKVLQSNLSKVKQPLSGCDLLQCLWEGHCHREHLLWRANCIRWVHMSVLIIMFFRVREVAKDDLVGLHLRRWRPLWTLSWDQLCLPRGDSLLVLYQTLQQNLNWI